MILPVLRLTAFKVPQGGVIAGIPSLLKNLLYPVLVEDHLKTYQVRT